MTDREKFEAEAIRRAEMSEYAHMNAVLKRAGDGYATSWVDMMWEGWQAALKQAEQDQASIKQVSSNHQAIPEGWIPVSERLPESPNGRWSENVIALTDSGNVFELACQGAYWQRSEAFIRSESTKVVAWMPIPAAPEGL